MFSSFMQNRLKPGFYLVSRCASSQNRSPEPRLAVAGPRDSGRHRPEVRNHVLARVPAEQPRSDKGSRLPRHPRSRTCTNVRCRPTGHESGTHEIVRGRDDRDRRGRLPDHAGREVSTCGDDVYALLDQVGGELGQLLGPPVCIADLKGDARSLNVPVLP